MIDLACLAVVGITLYCVSTEGLWGAVHTFLCVLLAGLIAMNFFEPLAGFLDGTAPRYRNYMDILALLGLFIGLTFALRLGSEHLTPVYIGLPATLDQVGKWAFGAATGYLTMAILLTALHTAPFPREFLGFKPERNNFFGMAPDRQWLGFVQYVTEKPFARIIGQDPDTKQFVTHAFDGKYERLGDKSAPYPNTIWPSFPIRYAMRREQLESNPAAGGAPLPAPIQLQPGGANPVAPGGNVGF
jgi:colicin V production protein